MRPMHLFFGDSSEDGLQASHWSKSLAGLEACRGFQGLQVAHGPHGFSQRAPIDVLSTDLHHPPGAQDDPSGIPAFGSSLIAS